MTLEELANLTHDVESQQAAEAPTLRLDSDEDITGVIAFFGQDRGRAAVRLVIRGEDAGYLERGDLLKLIRTRKMGWGDAGSTVLPGHVTPGSWRLYELECAVPGCEQSPVYVARYVEQHPPHCGLHPEQELRPRS
jgi:hypothetical protein